MSSLWSRPIRKSYTCLHTILSWCMEHLYMPTHRSTTRRQAITRREWRSPLAWVSRWEQCGAAAGDGAAAGAATTCKSTTTTISTEAPISTAVLTSIAALAVMFQIEPATGVIILNIAVGPPIATGRPQTSTAGQRGANRLLIGKRTRAKKSANDQPTHLVPVVPEVPTAALA